MADEDGEERSSLLSLAKTDSMDSRWVYELHDESEIEDEDDDADSQSKVGADSEEEDVAGHRLIRTGPRIDSFDVEALEVPGTHRHDFEDLLSVGRSNTVFRIWIEECDIQSDYYLAPKLK